MLNRPASTRRVEWTTTAVHSGLGICFGVPIVRALVMSWPGPLLPVPRALGVALVLVSGGAFLLTVLNLALKGLGAPFFIALSRKMATDWLYSRTRNPMVLAGLALLASVGVWYQSVLFVLWTFLLFAPALTFFVRVYEERELELRFGASYLAYKATTPMLLPSLGGASRARKIRRTRLIRLHLTGATFLAVIFATDLIWCSESDARSRREHPSSPKRGATRRSGRRSRLSSPDSAKTARPTRLSWPSAATCRAG